MNILLTIHHFLDPDSGAPGSVLKLGQCYQEMGHTVHYFAFDHLPQWVQSRSPEVVFPEFVAAHLLRHHAAYDVIDLSTGDGWVWGMLRSRVAPRSVFITRSHGLEHTVHHDFLEEARQGRLHLSWKYPLYRGGLRLWEVSTSLRSADRVCLLNRQEQAYAVKQLGVPLERTHVTHNGIPDALLGLPFEPLPDPEKGIGIAQIGTYIPRKGIHYSMPALNAILARHPQVRVSLLGTDCAEATVYADVDPAVRDRVCVIPRFRHDDLPTLLKGHQIKLFAPISEGFGKALVEAMACGLAPVTTAAAGPLEVVRDRHDGWVVPTRDAVALERSLDHLITHPTELERLRQNAYATAQQFSWRQAAQQRLSLYQDAINQRTTTP